MFLSLHIMEYSLHDIEETFNQLFDFQSQMRDQANAILLEWTNSDHAHIEAFYILKHSYNLTPRYGAATILKNKIKTSWSSLDPTLQNEIRDYLLNQIYQENTNLKEQLKHMLIIIAIHEWPEIWPGFLDSILTTSSDDPNFHSNLLLLEMFAKELEDCKYVTHSKLIQQRNYFIASIASIMQLLGVSLLTEENSIPALNILNSLLMWADISNFASNEIIDLLLSDFLVHEKTQQAALSCLTSLFLERNDCGPIIKMIIPSLVHAFAQLSSYSNIAVVFLVNFFRKYTQIIENMIFGDQSDPMSKKLSILLLRDDSETPPLDDYTIQLLPEVHSLFRVILSSQIDFIWRFEYWNLWINIMRRMLICVMTGRTDRPTFKLFSPIFSNIQAGLLASLPYAFEESKAIVQPAVCTWDLIARIDIDSYISFLSQLPLSPEVIYAVGCVSLGPTMLNNEGVVPFFSNMYSSFFSMTESNEIVQPILYSIARGTPIMEQNQELFDKYYDLLITCMLNREKEFQNAAIHSFLYAVNKSPDLFGNNQYILGILNQLDSILPNIDETIATLLIRAVTIMVARVKNDEETMFSLFDMIANSIVLLMPDFAPLALKMISEFAFYSNPTTAQALRNIWPSLIDCIQQEDPLLYENSYEAFSACIANCLLTEISDQVDFFWQTVFKIPRQFAYESIATIRSYHLEIDTYYSMVEDFIKNEDKLSRSLFTMIKCFDPNLFNISLIMNLAILGMNEIEIDISKEAISLIEEIMFGLAQEAREEFLKNYTSTIVSTTLSCMLDSMHMGAFSKQVGLIRQLYSFEKQMDFDYLEVLYTSFKQIIDEPSENFFKNFVAQVAESMYDHYGLKQMFSDLMIMMKKSTPKEQSQLLELELENESKKEELLEKDQKELERIYAENEDDIELPIAQLKSLSIYSPGDI